MKINHEGLQAKHDPLAHEAERLSQDLIRSHMELARMRRRHHSMAMLAGVLMLVLLAMLLWRIV